MDKFWMVLRNTGGGAPTKKHETIEQAKDEAARLARQSNESYYVLEVVGIVTLPEIEYEWKEI